MTMGESNKTPEYLSKFPLGKVPGLETASGFCLWESDAIAHYVAQSGPQTAKLLGSTPEEKAKVQQWIHFVGNHLMTAVIKLIGWRMGFGTYDAKTEEEASKELERWMQHLEGHFEKGEGEWLVKTGKGLSLADITAAGSVWLGSIGYMDNEYRARFPKTYDWIKRVQEDPEIGEIFEGEFLEKRKEPLDAA